MTILKLGNKIGSGNIPLNGVQYIASDESDITLGGDRFLKAGFVETDTVGLDASVIKNGIYFTSDIKSPIAASGNPETIVSDNGDVISYSSSQIQYSTDGGNNWSVATITIPAAYDIQSIETDHNGNWVAALGRGNVGYAPAYRRSIDGGATWTTLSVTGVTGDSNDHEVMYSRETGEWCIVQIATVNTSTTFAHFSTDLVTWVNQGLSVRLNSIGRYLPPTESNATWYFKGNDNSGTGNGFLRWIKNATGGLTTGTVNFSSPTYDYPNEFISSPILYFKQGSLFIGSGTGVDEVRIYRFPAEPTNGDSLDAGRFYPKTQYPNLEAGSVAEQPVVTFDGKAYLSSWYTPDGYEFLPLGGENLDKYRVANGKLYAQGVTTDTHVSSIPVAGSVVPHSQGGASQYVKISEGV